MFLGGEGLVDGILSSQWINEQLDDQGVRYDIVLNAAQEQALEMIRSEGSLIVFCSIQENVRTTFCLNASEDNIHSRMF